MTRQLEFWRTDAANGIPWYKEGEALCIDTDEYDDADGAAHFIVSGRGYLDLLRRTVNQSESGTAGAHKTGAAETIMKAYVDEQAGPGAGARARLGLTIQADGANGNTLDRSFAYTNLLELCQSLSIIGGGDFDVVGTGAATFEFRWYTGQRGTDRRTTVIFSESYGNMGEPRLTTKRSDVINAVLVTGQGVGTGRDLVWRTDPASIALSPWGQIEQALNATEVDKGNITGLENKGDAKLAENVMTEAFSFRVLQTPGCLYGKHYFLGDLVTAFYRGNLYTRKVQRATLSMDPDGEEIDAETIGIVTEGYYDEAMWDETLWA